MRVNNLGSGNVMIICGQNSVIVCPYTDAWPQYPERNDSGSGHKQHRSQLRYCRSYDVVKNFNEQSVVVDISAVE